MKVPDPFHMNDWDIRRFLVVLLAFQLSIWGLVGLDLIGIQIPLLRHLIGFVYISFFPGILILRILKIHNTTEVQTVLYSVGLSVSTIMLIGFVVNAFYPLIWIHQPISIIPLIATISIVVLILSIVCYLVDGDFSNTSFISTSEILHAPFLLLSLIPLLSIIGTYCVNFCGNNIILMLLIAGIAIVAILIGYGKFIPINLIPFAIWVLSLALIWHYTLITGYAAIHDGEYYYANMVIENGYWDIMVGSIYNSIISVTLFTPIIQIITNLHLTWVYKVLFPFYLSLLPLAVYSLSRNYVNSRMAFLAAFVVLISTEYYIALAQIPKQFFAMFFLALFFMIIFTRTKPNVSGLNILALIFILAVIVSHYGTSFLVAVSLIFILPILLLQRQIFKAPFLKEIFFRLSNESKVINLSIIVILIYFVSHITWSIYIANSVTFEAVISIIDQTTGSMFLELFNPEGSRGAYMLLQDQSMLRQIHKLLKLSVIGLISIGLLNEIIHIKETKFNILFFSFVLYYYILMVASVAVSSFAVMGPGRLYILALLLMAPLAVIGGLTIIKPILKGAKINGGNTPIKILTFIFVVLLLFNTQFIYVLAKENPSSISIGQEYVKLNGDIEDKYKLYSNLIKEQDMITLDWLAFKGDKSKNLYFTGGYTSIGTVLSSSGHFPIENIFGQYRDTYKDLSNDASMSRFDYVFLLYVNVKEDIALTTIPDVVLGDYYTFSTISKTLTEREQIYNNGCSKILYYNS